VGDQQLTCTVTATNPGGSASATSAAARIGLGAQPKVVTQPTIQGTSYDSARGAYVAAPGDKLTCSPGTWANATPFREIWFADIAQAATGGLGGARAGVQRIAFALGSSVNVPDYPVSANVSAIKGRTSTVYTDIQCVVDASGNGDPLVSATAVIAGSGVDRLLIKQLAPVLALPRSPKTQCTASCGPVISPDVGYGQTNTCNAGQWLHNPSSYSYQWLVRQVASVPYGPATVVGTSQTLHMSYAEELHYIYCRVTASNAAGSASAISNGYIVPRLGFVALGPAQIIEEQPGPARPVPTAAAGADPVNPLLPDQSKRWRFSCKPPSFNKTPATVSYYWAAWWDGGPNMHAALGDIHEGIPPVGDSPIPPASGVILVMDTNATPVLVTTLGGLQAVTGDQFDASGTPAWIECYVYATSADGQTAFATSSWAWVTMPSVLGN
jgi:hypothetical protein